jgi:hypothetical protein
MERKLLNRFMILYVLCGYGYCRIKLWNRIEKSTEKRVHYIHLVSILETDTNTNIHITSFSGYGCRIIKIIHFHFPSLQTNQQNVVLFRVLACRGSDTNTDIHITSFSGYGCRIIKIIHFHFPSPQTNQQMSCCFACWPAGVLIQIRIYIL